VANEASIILCVLASMAYQISFFTQICVNGTERVNENNKQKTVTFSVKVYVYSRSMGKQLINGQTADQWANSRSTECGVLVVY